LQLLVTANVVPSSLIFSTLMIEAIQEPHGFTSQMTIFFNTCTYIHANSNLQTRYSSARGHLGPQTTLPPCTAVFAIWKLPQTEHCSSQWERHIYRISFKIRWAPRKAKVLLYRFEARLKPAEKFSVYNMGTTFHELWWNARPGWQSPNDTHIYDTKIGKDSEWIWKQEAGKSERRTEYSPIKP
jgi:hypothetical protein